MRFAFNLRITTKQLSLVCVFAALLLSIVNISASVLLHVNHGGAFESPTVIDDSQHPIIYYNEDNDDDETTTQPLHVVLSHCKRSIDWVWEDYFQDGLPETNSAGKDYSIKSVTILSKCGVPLKRKEIPVFRAMGQQQEEEQQLQQEQEPPVVSVLSLPNVGRCDHSYAYWIRSMLLWRKDDDAGTKQHPEHEVLYSNYVENDKNADPLEKIAGSIETTDLVLFLKDNDNSYRQAYFALAANKAPGAMFEEILYNNLDTQSIAAANETVLTLREAKGYTLNSRGFACGQDMERYHLNWAHRSILWRFEIDEYVTGHNQVTYLDAYFKSDYPTMGKWIRHFNAPSKKTSSGYNPLKSFLRPEPPAAAASEPAFSKAYLDTIVENYPREKKYVSKNTRKYLEHDLSPICLGGVFGTVWGQIASGDAPVTSHGWDAITRALARSDNIEEGHYMERWWADLLSWSSYAATELPGGIPRPTGVVLSEAEQARLLERKKIHHSVNSPDHETHPYAGILVLDQKRMKQAAMLFHYEQLVTSNTNPKFNMVIEDGEIVYKRNIKKRPKEEKTSSGDLR